MQPASHRSDSNPEGQHGGGDTMKRALWILLLALFVGPAASAQIAQRGTATTTASTLNSGSLIITKPTGVVSGDLMIANLVQVNSLTPPTAPTGWTTINQVSLAGTTNRFASVFYKVAGGAEGANYTFTIPTGAAGEAIGAIIGFWGVNSTTPFDVTPGTILVNASGTTVTATGVTTVTANDAVVMLGEAAASAPTWSAFHDTTPGTMATILNFQGTNTTIGAGWVLKPTTGATGNGLATLSTPGERNGGILLALKPGTAVPTITKGFAPATITTGNTSVLTLTITNPSATVTQSSVAVSDSFPTGMTISTVGSTTCPSGTLTGNTVGSGTISLSGGTLAVSASCTVTVTVADSTAGTATNTTGTVSSNNGTGSTANATLTVVGPPTIAKSFAPASVPVNTNSVLTLTITNPAANTVALTGLAVTDSFPANLVVAGTPGLTNTCNGTITGGTAAATSVGLTNGSVLANSSCTISVNVDSATAGSFPNTTGAVSSTNGGTGAVSNTATLTVTTPPSIAKAFSPTSIPLTGTPSTLTLTITNPSATQTQAGLAVTDTFPAGLVVATPPASSNSGCGGTFTATQGAGSISLTAGSLAVSTSCTLVVNVSATSAGSKSNTTGTVSSTNGGNGNTANAVLTVIAPPTITKGFAPASIAIGGTSTLTITITNPAGNLGAENGVAVTDNLPAGMSVASTPGATNSCGGTFAPNAGDTSLNLSGGSIATAGTSCAISVSVTDSTAGAVTNTTGAVSSTNGGTGLTANAAFTVNNPPTVTKTFVPTIVAPGASSQMTITITNPAGNSTLTGVNFTDTFPAGLVVQNPNGASTTGCTGSTFSPLPNATAVTLSVPASVTAGTPCVVKVNVQSPTVGSYLNSTGPVTSTNAGPSTAATATLVVAVPPAITKTFVPATIAVGGTSTLTLNFTNSASNLGAMNGIAVTDTFPAGMQVASSPNIGNSCGATFAPAAGNTILTVTNGTIATPGTTCEVNVDVTATTAGSKSNTTGAVSSTNDGTGTTANAVLTVVAPPTITKAFGSSAAGIPSGGTSTMTITITNPAANTVAETGVAVSDTLPGTMTFSVAPTTNCTGATLTPTANSVSISGATINTGASCTITGSVTDTTTGSDVNITGTVSSTNGGTGLTATATLLINAAPTVTKAFAPTNVALNATSQLTITITNPNTISLTGVAITDNLPAGMVVQATGTDTGCTGATFSDVVNSSLISITGASVANGTPCVIKVNVKSSTPGANVNTTGTVSSTNGGTGGTATATLTVTAPPTITKAFVPATVAVGGTSTLTLTFTNPAANSGAMNGIAVTDTFPAGMQVASVPNIGNTCSGATFTPVAGNTSLTVTGGTLANPGDTCQVNVDVTSSTAGSRSNTTGTVSSTNDGTGLTANAVLTVVAPPTITKAFGSSATGIPAGGTSTMTITITNPAANTVAETGVAVSDTLPGTMTFSTQATTTCTGATLVGGAPTANTVSISGGSINTGASCTITASVTDTTTGSDINTTGTVSSTNGGTGLTATATLSINAPPTVTKTFTLAGVPPNTTSALTITITNPNTPNLTGVAITDNLPSGLVIQTPNGGSDTGCTGATFSDTAGATVISITGATVANGTPCVIKVNVKAAAAGVYNNTTNAVTSTNGGTGTTASATLTVNVVPTIAKSFLPTSIPVGATTVVTLTLSNSNTDAITGAAVTDTFPAGMTVTATPGASNTCGGTFTATANATSISLTGGTIPASGSCAVSANVTSTTVGNSTNTTTAGTTTNAGASGTANATLTVVAPAIISKTFNPSSTQINNTSLLTLTFGNPAANTTAQTGLAVTDNFPGSLQVASPAGATNTCGGTFSPNPGDTSITLSGGTIAQGGGCAISVSVVSANPGSFTNTTGTVSSTQGGTGLTASATLTVLGAASQLAFSVQPTNTTAGGVISPAVTVLVQDSGGNIITTGAGSAASVTMAIGSNPASGVLGGTLTVNAVSGVATFSTLTINTQGTGYTLSASSAGLTSATSNAFNITPPIATYIQPFNAGHGWTYQQTSCAVATTIFPGSCTNSAAVTTAADCQSQPCVDSSVAAGFQTGGSQSGYFHSPIGSYTWQTLGVPANAAVTSVQGGWFDLANGCSTGTTAGIQIFDSGNANEITSPSVAALVAINSDTAVTQHALGAAATVNGSSASSSTGITLRFNLNDDTSGFLGTCTVYGDTFELVISYTPNAGGGGGRRGQVVIAWNRQADGSMGAATAYDVELADGAAAIAPADLKLLSNGRSGHGLDPVALGGQGRRITKLEID